MGRRGQVLDVFFFKLEITGFPDALEGGERQRGVEDVSNVFDATAESMELFFFLGGVLGGLGVGSGETRSSARFCTG